MSEIIKRLEPEIKVIENDNHLELVDLGLALQAVGDKIIVLMDQYKSGYECKVCGGTGKIEVSYRCVCDPVNYDPEVHVQPGTRNRHGAPCEECGGDYISKRVNAQIRQCSTCKGLGGTLAIPESAQSLPTTGIVMSCGPDVKNVKIHSRIIATPHSGVFLPMKGNIPIKIYREHEPLCYLYTINESPEDAPVFLESPLFVEHDTPLTENANA